MISIDESNITITKGDTLLVTIDIERNGSPYMPQEGDKVRFAMKNAYTDEECMLNIDIPIDTLLLNVPADTMKTIPVNKKGYVYDVQLTTADGIVDTFISGKVYVTAEVE